MKAIQTKYIGPTLTKSGRIKAFAEGVPSVILGFDHALDSYENRLRAAEELARRCNWIDEKSEHVVGGALPGQGYAFLILDKELGI